MFRDRSMPLVVGAVAGLAILGAMLSQGKPAPPHDSAEHEKPIVKEAPAAEQFQDEGENPLTPVYRFLGEIPPRPEKVVEQKVDATFHLGLLDLHTTLPLKPEVTGPKGPEDLYKWPKQVREGTTDYAIECMIVTVPHPKKSGLGYWYDLTLDAIERAFEQDLFVLDRSWLPPDFRVDSPKPDPAGTTAKPPPVGGKPGVLLFRSAESGKKALRVVFLVGETPTSGIRINPFKTAVALHCSRTKGDPPPVRIVGPFFSGSHASLMLALRQASAPNFAFRIYNGSATAIDGNEYKNYFAERAPTLGAAIGPGLWIGDKSEYHTTVIPDKIVTTWVKNYLVNPIHPQKGGQLRNVAILRESNTGYGAYTYQLTPGQPMAGQPMAGPTTHADVIDIPFPIHISNCTFRENLSTDD